MKGKVLVVGDQPRFDKGTDKPFDLAGSKGKLERWLNELGVTEYVLTNQVYEDFEKVAKAHRGPILALGEKASKKLKKIQPMHYRLPHPSGRNRLLNDKENEKFVIQDCKRWLDNEIIEPTPYHKDVDVKGKGNSWK